MKTNKILLLIFLGMTLSSFSQEADPLEKGNYFIETNLRGGFINGANKDWVLNIRPTIGTFIRDKWAVGATSKLELFKRTFNFGNSEEDKHHIKTIQAEIGLFTQYYVVGGLYSKISATAGLAQGKYTDHPNWNKFSYTVSPEIGYDFFLGKKKKLALGVSFSYDFSNIETYLGDAAYPIPKMINSSGLKFNLSVKFMLGKKK